MPTPKSLITLLSTDSIEPHGKSPLLCSNHNPPDDSSKTSHLDAIFIACDCAGEVHTDPLLLEESKRELVQCIVGFSFGHLLGYDLTMKHSAGNTITAISISGEQYTVINRLFKSSVMRGCTTQCWHVHGKDSIEYIIKDSWIDSRQVNEIEILGELTGVENVSTLVKGWDVTLPDGKMDTMPA